MYSVCLVGYFIVYEISAIGRPNCARHNITALGVRTKCPRPILPTDPLEEMLNGDGAVHLCSDVLEGLDRT